MTWRHPEISLTPTNCIILSQIRLICRHFDIDANVAIPTRYGLGLDMKRS
jgi:hypothetical protein